MKPYQMLIVGLIVFGVVQQFRIGQAHAATEAARVRGDSIAAERLVAEFANDSAWTVRFAEHAEDLGQMIVDGDMARARLAGELQAANVRIGLLAEVSASARGEIITLSDRAGLFADSVNALGEVVDSWRGQLDDGLLTGSWSFTLPEAQHVLAYTCTVPGELIVGESGDGRTIVSARATHPRASLDLGELLFDPPDPVVLVKLSKTQALVALLIGAVGWEFAR